MLICFAPANYKMTQAEKQQLVIDHNSSCKQKHAYYAGYLKLRSTELIEWVKFEKYQIDPKLKNN